jgi:acetoin utilization deacetylase AcuC-like enzyme
MRVALLHHDASLRHDTGPWHPERPERIGAVVRGVHQSGLEVVAQAPPLASPDLVGLVHRDDYVAAVERFCAGGGGALDADTVVGADSWEAALRAAGSGRAAAEALLGGGADTAFVAMRPPGHHALPDRAMGFCLFNNVGITARWLVEEGYRVAIVDWDVHHGNGTQDLFYTDPTVFYISFHEFPAYPGSGWIEEQGRGQGRGLTLNLPFPNGTGGAPYRWAMRWLVQPRLERFAPDWVLVSAGYDAHDADPLAGLRLHESDYGVLASLLAAVVPPNRIIFLLEGGYNLAALTGSVAATLRGVAGDADEPPDPEAMGEGGAWRVIQHLSLRR